MIEYLNELYYQYIYTGDSKPLILSLIVLWAILGLSHWKLFIHKKITGAGENNEIFEALGIYFALLGGPLCWLIEFFETNKNEIKNQ